MINNAEPPPPLPVAICESNIIIFPAIGAHQTRTNPITRPPLASRGAVDPSRLETYGESRGRFPSEVV